MKRLVIEREIKTGKIKEEKETHKKKTGKRYSKYKNLKIC